MHATYQPSPAGPGHDVAAGELAARSVVKYHALLHKIFALSVIDGVVPANPCAHTELPKVILQRKRIITVAQFDAILATIPARYRTMVLPAIETGLRSVSSSLRCLGRSARGAARRLWGSPRRSSAPEGEFFPATSTIVRARTLASPCGVVERIRLDGGYERSGPSASTTNSLNASRARESRKPVETVSPSFAKRVTTYLPAPRAAPSLVFNRSVKLASGQLTISSRRFFQNIPRVSMRTKR